MARNAFVQGGIYHICNKSISNFNIFHDEFLVSRFLEVVEYYNSSEHHLSYSKLEDADRQFTPLGLLSRDPSHLVRVLAYCIMPDHYHLLIAPLIQDNKAIYLYISKIENSFTRYFNLKKNRKGPLWQSRFRSVVVKSDEQLLHVSRYIHLNPVTVGFVDSPESWPYTSYSSYMDETILQELHEISIRTPQAYKTFVENNKDYQKTLKRIKSRLLE
jgi:putative transposase